MPIKYETHITRMLEAVYRPKGMAVVECKDHQKGDSEIIQGNQAASQQEPLLQSKYTEKDKPRANEKGFSLDNSPWYLFDEILVIPQNLQCKLFKALHDSSHLGQMPYKLSFSEHSKVKDFPRCFNK